MTLRTPELEWCHRAAAGSLGDEWVDASVDPGREHWQEQDGRFAGVGFAKFLPPELVRAAQQAQAAGDPTLLEALQLLFARLTWIVRNRPRLWTELSPVPGLLAHLVESHGVEASVHAHDPETLARLAARLDGWRRRRGELNPTLELLEEGAGVVPHERLQQPGQEPRRPADLVDEVFACHDDRWWAVRQHEDAEQVLRIEGGYLKFQDPSDPGFSLLREDVLAVASDERRWTRQVVRLLAGWTTLRPVLQKETP